MLFTELSRAEKLGALKLEAWRSLVVVAYILVGYLSGIAMILNGSFVMGIVGTLLLTHTTVLSGLLNHEFIHRVVVRNARINDWLGNLMSMLNGACQVPFDMLRRQHMAHHVHKVGYDSFSVTQWAMALPKPLRECVLALEFCYFPILTFVARARALTYPFRSDKYRNLRPRIVLVTALRVLMLGVFYWVNPWSLVWLFLAHVFMVTIFRLYDCYHHTFQIIPLHSQLPELPQGYEQERTFSSLLSRKHSWLNSIFLNYGYHNAHHYLFAAPWYQLPQIDRLMFGASECRHILFRDWIRWYHRNRIQRIKLGLGSPGLNVDRPQLDSFYGIIMNLSFLDYDYNDE